MTPEGVDWALCKDNGRRRYPQDLGPSSGRGRTADIAAHSNSSSLCAQRCSKQSLSRRNGLSWSRTSRPAEGKAENMSHRPTSAVTQTPTLAKGHAYLPQRSTLPTTPPSLERQVPPGPLEYVEPPNVPTPVPAVAPVARTEGVGKFPLVPRNQSKLQEPVG